MNIVERLVEYPVLFAVFADKAAIRGHVGCWLNETDICSNDIRRGMFSRKVFGPNTRTSSYVKYSARLTNGSHVKFSIHHQLPKLVLKVEAVLLILLCISLLRPEFGFEVRGQTPSLGRSYSSKRGD